MQLTMEGESSKTKIQILPFINLNPSDISTIYTALSFAQKECEKYNIKFAPVTFDQPLYIKAADIILALDDLKNLVLRLEGFHLVMSYM